MEVKTNGRLDIIHNSCFTHSDKLHVSDPISFRQPLTGNWSDNKLSILFFSQQNQKTLQNGIRAGVYKLSNGVFNIGEQSYDELKIIMRSIFLQYSKNNKKNITAQVKGLNDLVLDYAVKQVHGEAEAYMKYKFDVSTLAMPMDRPNMNHIDSKELKFQERY